MGAIRERLAEEHQRIEALLGRIVTVAGLEDLEAYDAFRGALLRHIGVEEKILGPIAKERGAKVDALRDRLRADHARLAVLLMKRPTLALVVELREILTPHDALEEGPGGFYELCETAIGAHEAQVVALIAAAPEVPLRPLPGPGERPRPRRIDR